MTVNKQQKANITIEQLSIYTTVKLQSWGDVFQLHKERRNEGGSEKTLEAVNLSKTS